MDLLNELRQLNRNNINNNIDLEKQQVIAKILEDDDCFFNIPIEVSFSILSDLGIQNKKDIYLKLVDANLFNCISIE